MRKLGIYIVLGVGIQGAIAKEEVVVDGDTYRITPGERIERTVNKFGNKLFENRLGILDGSKAVKSIEVYKNTLLGLQKNGRLWAYGQLGGTSGVWSLIGVNFVEVGVSKTKLLALGTDGILYVYTGNIQNDLVNSFKTWKPTAWFGNSFYAFKKTNYKNVENFRAISTDDKVVIKFKDGSSKEIIFS